MKIQKLQNCLFNMISIQIQEWQQMKAKLSKLQQQVLILRNQNQDLQKKLKLKQENQNKSSQSSVNVSVGQNEKQNNKSQQLLKLPHFDGSNKQLQCFLRPCSNAINSQAQSDLSSIQSFDKVQANLHQISNINQIQQRIEQDDHNVITVSRKSYKSIQLKNIMSNKKLSDHQMRNQLHFIQDICVFGPNIQKLHQITFKHDEKQLFQPQLYYPEKSQQYLQYGNYFFPKKIRVKPTQKNNIQMEANKIIFKNSKKQDCNIFIFQGNQAHPIKKPNEVLQKVNPSKWLYAIVMEFQDFVFQDTKQQKNHQEQVPNLSEFFSPSLGKKNKGSLLQLDVRNFHEEQLRLETVSLKDIEFQRQTQHMFRSTFSLCIFTYFPFVSYLQNLIYAIFDEVKLKRIEHFPKTSKFKDCDIFYFINELNHIITRISTYFSSHSIKMRKQLSLNVNQTLLKIDLSQENLYEQLYGNWSYKIIRMLDKDLFYEIFCMIMLEQSVYFVCQDQKILTFMILLFSSMLTQPFSYPYPVISVIFSQELLQTPFTSLIGINQSQKWVQQAVQNNLIDLQTKHVIIVTEKQVKIKRDFKYNPPKSQSLRKIFTKYYKKVQPSSLTSILLRRDSLSSISDVATINEQVINFFVKLQLFYHENIFSYMPNKMTISKLDSNLNNMDGEINKASVRNELLDHIQKFYKKSNPNYYKDEFVKQFVKTQIFSICLMQEYQIQC